MNESWIAYLKTRKNSFMQRGRPYTDPDAHSQEIEVVLDKHTEIQPFVLRKNAKVSNSMKNGRERLSVYQNKDHMLLLRVRYF